MDTTVLFAAVFGAEAGGLLTLALDRRVGTALRGRRLQWLGAALLPVAMVVELLTRGGGQSHAGHRLVFWIVTGLVVLCAACNLAGVAATTRHKRTAESDA